NGSGAMLARVCIGSFAKTPPSKQRSMRSRSRPCEGATKMQCGPRCTWPSIGLLTHPGLGGHAPGNSESVVMPEAIRGKTFVLAPSSSDDSSLDEAAQLLAHLGGVVVGEVTPELDYLVVLDRRPGRPTGEEKKADALNEGGAAIQVLDAEGFRDL